MKMLLFLLSRLRKQITELHDIDEKALYYRAPYTSQPGVLPYIPAPASYNETAGSASRSDKNY